MITQLRVGEKRAGRTFFGWSRDGTGHAGYHVDDFFDNEDRYLGADEHNIEPLFVDHIQGMNTTLPP